MLRLVNIVKNYKVADQEVPALKGLTLAFRKNEFVSILGPSGCGKTTTLNIIGGLDKYTSGDLVINGVSTTKFNDRDWDVYRNHRVGFIFQAYNLIPHQTILENVELALTIAGISKSERVRRSKEALIKVGLEDHINKKPNQLSGGQCQRVAIARALVNDPEILLADEPTGALDTQTSVQVMDLIKEISKERLVIMVTHNPELAEKYSTRIVKLLDGELLSDSNPYSLEEEIKEVEDSKLEAMALEEETLSRLDENGKKNYKKNKKENAKMSFWTAFKLSARNLRSKAKRTTMVALAGCIGIVGVSTVLAVSTGVSNYIDDMQNDMISGNPITITESGVDYSSLLDASSTMQQTDATKAGWEDGKVNVNSMIEYLAEHSDAIESMLYSQNISSDYVKYVKDMPKEYYSAIKINYGAALDNNIYTNYTIANNNAGTIISDSENTKVMSVTGIKAMYTTLLGKTEYKEYSSIITSLSEPFMQYLDNKDYVLSQYDVVEGHYPENAHEIVLVLDEDGSVSDLTLAQMGYYTQEEFFNLVYNTTTEGFDSTTNPYKKNFSYEEILNREFRLYYNDSVYSQVGSTFTYNMSNPSGNYETIKVSGIIKLKSGISYGSLSSGFYYTDDLVNLYRENSKTSSIVKYLNDNNKDSFENLMYNYSYYYRDGVNNPYVKYIDGLGVLGSSSSSGILSMMGGSSLGYSFKLTMRDLGVGDNPYSISIYSSDFSHKSKVCDYLDSWNKNKTLTLTDGTTITHETTEGNISEIKYTDQVGVIMSMIDSLVSMVTIALVAFTALSLVVSTVMVGIITYVSVVERIKEIGVIRSLGGRKKDVSHLFNAETFIIGLSSGVLGIVITGIIVLFLNILVNALAGFSIAALTPTIVIVMICLSVLLTLISGLIPAKAAANKNPVEALRSE